MTYRLGVDIGIASVGFAAVEIDKDGNSQKLLRYGSHIFDVAEVPKTGASLALARRVARGQRRVTHRRAQRKNQIRRLLAEYGFQNIDSIDAKMVAGETSLTPWDLRAEALKRKLTDGELARVLFHIAKRRGFQSNRKDAGENDIEGKKALSGGKALEEKMIHAATPTIGAYLATLSKKRNGNGSYENFVMRDLLRSEVKSIFETQRKFGNTKASTELCDAYQEKAFFQRPLRSSIDLVGKCSWEPTEERAPKFSYSAELFILWNKINHLRIRTQSGQELELNQDEKNRIANRAHELSKLTYQQIRKELDIPDDAQFNIGYRKTNDKDDTKEKVHKRAEDATFITLTGYQTLKDALGDSPSDWARWTGKDRDKLDEIARIISFHEDEAEIRKLLAPIITDSVQCDALVRITKFSKTVNLSVKAINKILPFMQQGMTYDKACTEAGYNFGGRTNKGLKKLPAFEDIRNPVVNRALARTRKVINAILREHGMPHTIVVELAREVGKTREDRNKIETEQKKNQERKESIRTEIEGDILNGRTANGEDIIKYRLWKEQKCFCCYCGEVIRPDELADGMATQVDHIIPYSRSWDDGYMNKVVCHATCNQEKQNRTPFEWLGATGRWQSLLALAKDLPGAKARRFLTEEFNEDERKTRNLNDTRYIARELKNHLEANLNLGEGNRVQTRNGALTAHLRRSWGFPEKDRTNDRHHAVDAIVLACSNQSMVQRLSEWNKYESRRRNPAEKPLPPAPWEGFRDEIMNKVFGPKNAEGKREGGILVTRMPVRKNRGAVHEATIRSIRQDDDGKQYAAQRVKLNGDFKLGTLESMIDKDGRNKHLYDLIKAHLAKHDNNPKKAFAEKIYLAPKGDKKEDPKNPWPVINTITIRTNEKSGVQTQGGLASNGDMIRVDVFCRTSLKGKKQSEKKEYFLIPIYVHHIAQTAMPQHAIIQGKDEKDWELMDDNDFIFSLYKNDYVRLKDGEDLVEGYYAGTDRATGAILLTAHDNDKNSGKDGKYRKGVKTILGIEKYNMDYFGNLNRILKEPRLGLAHHLDSESGESDD